LDEVRFCLAWWIFPRLTIEIYRFGELGSYTKSHTAAVHKVRALPSVRNQDCELGNVRFPDREPVSLHSWLWRLISSSVLHLNHLRSEPGLLPIALLLQAVIHHVGNNLSCPWHRSLKEPCICACACTRYTR
jgi:hypothetical protein